MQTEELDYKLIFESAPGLFLVLDPSFTILTASNAYLSATMRTREEITGKNIFEVFPDNPSDPGATGVAMLRNSLETVLAEKKPHTMPIQKYDIRRPDGTFEEKSWKPFNLPVPDETGEIRFIIHRVEDVTDVARLEKELCYKEELGKNERKFRFLIENNQESIILLDENFKPFYRSPASLRTTGYSEEELQNREPTSGVHPDDQESLRLTRENVLANPGKTFFISLRNLHKAGHYIWLEGWLTNLLHEESVKAIVLNMRDVTLRKKAEEQQQLLASIINFSEDAIVSCDREGMITSWNAGAENLFGASGDEVIGESVSMFVPEHLKQEQQEIIRRINRGELVQHYETTRIKKDGSSIEVSITASPIRNAEGSIIGVSKISHDISALKKANAAIIELNERLEKRAKALQESNHELEQFAYIASHDLREPLRMVSSFLDLLKKRYHGKLDQTADQYIHFAVDGAERMKTLILNLLEYSRIGFAKEDFERVELMQLMKYVTLVFKEDLAAPGTVLMIHMLPEVMGRKEQLTQLFQNIVGNAIKYRSEAPLKIEIGCVEKADEWEFFVVDNGIGIDEQFFEKIFLIFQRLHNRSEYSGTGIGLSICRKIVESHGGRMWVESSPGKGSTFRFTIARHLILN